MPRRRRGAGAMAIEVEAERGLAMRILLYSPKDMAAGVLAFAAVGAIVANALFLQSGHHPAPMFGAVVAIPAAALTPASPLPRPRPPEAGASPAELKPADPRPSDPRPSDPKSANAKPVDAKSVDAKSAEAKSAEAKSADPLTNLVKATGTPQAAIIPRPPAPIPVSTRNDTAASSGLGSRRVAAIQRALTEYGYGQLKPTGTVGSDTQAAIQKFERDRKIPVTGQMSDRLVRELTAMIGHPID
jgi:hypothetical protein